MKRVAKTKIQEKSFQGEDEDPNNYVSNVAIRK